MKELRDYEVFRDFSGELKLKATVVDKHTHDLIVADGSTQLIKNNIKAETIFVPEVVKPGLSFTVFVSQTCKNFYLTSIVDISLCFIFHQIKTKKMIENFWLMMKDKICYWKQAQGEIL